MGKDVAKGQIFHPQVGNRYAQANPPKSKKGKNRPPKKKIFFCSWAENLGAGTFWGQS